MTFRVSSAPLQTAQVEVWHVTLADAPARAAALQPLLSLDERDRAHRFAFDRDRTRWTCCRAGLRLLLSRLTGVAATQLRFRQSAYGKPQLVEHQAGDPPLCFNVSHSGNHVVYAFTRAGEVGIDIECARFGSDWSEIASRYFSRLEQQHWRHLPDDQKVEAFFRLWTRKEAFLKAVGTGLNLPLDSFSVNCDPPATCAVLQVPSGIPAAGQWSLLDITDLLPGENTLATQPATAALAIARRPVKITMRNATLADFSQGRYP